MPLAVSDELLHSDSVRNRDRSGKASAFSFTGCSSGISLGAHLPAGIDKLVEGVFGFENKDDVEFLHTYRRTLPKFGI